MDKDHTSQTSVGHSRKTPGGSQNDDLIVMITGPFGRYQFLLCVIIFLTKVAVAVHQMAIIFLAPKVSYTCEGAEGDSPCPCDKPIYDRTVFSRTIIMEFNLICDRKWLAGLAQTTFQFGTLIGSVFFGMASDRYGRRIPFIFACMMQIIFGIWAAYATTYNMFTILRFIVGVTVGGTMVIGFVIIMEFIGGEYREVVSALYQVPFNFGHMLLPAAGYFFRDYSDFLLVISAPEVIFIIYFCLLPETPRWLVAMKKTERAITILEKVAKSNRRPTDTVREDVLAYQAAAEKNKLKKGSIIDLFRTPYLRRNSLAMSFNWLACSYCFYGVSQYVGQLSGNLFINVACCACVTMIGTFLSIPLMKVMGRKTIIIVCNIIGSICLIALGVIPEGILSVVCACFGVVMSFIVFVVVYLYCGEMFPTVVRNAAIGFSSMAARIGSMIAPFVIETRDIAFWMPAVAFALVPFCAALVTMYIMPDTKGCKLTTTIEEGERMLAMKSQKQPIPT